MSVLLRATLASGLLATGAVVPLGVDARADRASFEVLVEPVVDGASAPHIASPSDTVRYDVTIVNLTHDDVRNVQVVPRVELGSGDLGPHDTCGWDSIGDGATMQCSMSYKVVQQDIDNGAVIIGFDASANGAVDGTASVVINAKQSPGLALAATASSAPAPGGGPGQRVTFALAARNTGNVTIGGLSGSVVVDARGGAQVADAPCTPTALGPGGTSSCVTTVDVTPGDDRALAVSGIGSVTGTPPPGVSGTVEAKADQADVVLPAGPSDSGDGSAGASTPVPAATGAGGTAAAAGEAPSAAGAAAGTGGVVVRPWLSLYGSRLVVPAGLGLLAIMAGVLGAARAGRETTSQTLLVTRRRSSRGTRR